MPRDVEEFIHYEREGKTLIVLDNLEELSKAPRGLKNVQISNGKGSAVTYYFDKDRPMTDHDGESVVALDKVWDDNVEVWRLAPTTGNGCYVKKLVDSVKVQARVLEVGTKAELRRVLDTYREGSTIVGGSLEIKLTSTHPYIYDLSDYELTLVSSGTANTPIKITGKGNENTHTKDYVLRLKKVSLIGSSALFVNLTGLSEFWKEDSPENCYVEILGAESNPAPCNIVYKGSSVDFGVRVEYGSYLALKGLKTTKAYIRVANNSELALVMHQESDIIGYASFTGGSQVTTNNFRFDTLYVNNTRYSGAVTPAGDAPSQNIDTFDKGTAPYTSPSAYFHENSLGYMSVNSGQDILWDKKRESAIPHNYRSSRGVSNIEVSTSSAVYLNVPQLLVNNYKIVDNFVDQRDVRGVYKNGYTDFENNYYLKCQNRSEMHVSFVGHRGGENTNKVGNIYITNHSSIHITSGSPKVEHNACGEVLMRDYAYLYSNKKHEMTAGKVLNIAQVCKIVWERVDGVSNKHKFSSSDLLND